MKFRHGRFFSCIALFIALAAAFPLCRQYAQTPQKTFKIDEHQIHRLETLTPTMPDDAPSEGFVIERTEKGAECRQMTVKEARQMKVDERPVELHSITGERQSLAQQGFKIMLRGTEQLENNPAAKQAFLRAAARWEAIIQNTAI